MIVFSLSYEKDGSVSNRMISQLFLLRVVLKTINVLDWISERLLVED